MNLFLKCEVRTPDVSVAHSPYLAARREWDERYGDLITRTRNWRTMAALCSLIALVATAGMVWLSARSHVVPFVVLVDNLGRPVASGVADQTSLNDNRLKRSNIFNWVENLRMVTTDGVHSEKPLIAYTRRSRAAARPRRLSASTTVATRPSSALKRRPCRSK